MNVLLTCAGRRTYLVTAFKAAVGGAGRVLACDASADAPALQEGSSNREDHASSVICTCSFSRINGAARTGKPACGPTAWPAYRPKEDQLMEFGVSSGLRKNFRKPYYDADDAALDDN